jgi:stage II sporulation protein D
VFAHSGRAPSGRFFLLITMLSFVVAVDCGGGRTTSRVSATRQPWFSGEPTLHVGMAWGDSALEVGGDGRWWIHEAGNPTPIAAIEGRVSWRIIRLPFENALRVARPDGYLSEPHTGPLLVDPLGPEPISLAGQPLPGSVQVQLRPDGTLTGVNVVPIERYLEGVVAKELGQPGSGAFEALRAQAVAARTYALKRKGSRADLGFDVYGTVLDQAYKGLVDAADSLAVRAVETTRGEALLYNGALIDAYYHSTCGGHTARVELVFDDPPAPYLVSVSDRRPDGNRFWCQESKYFRWTATFDGDQLDATVARNLQQLLPLPPAGAGTVRDIEILNTTPEGRVVTVAVTTTTGRYLVSENDIRMLFADAEGRWLRSTMFLARPTYSGGRVAELSLVGGGWGHGVGMCQVGAMARARAGQGYGEVLGWYYPGTTITRLY